MSPARDPSDDAKKLAASLRDPGFSPGARHVAPLLALLDDEQEGELAERALSRMGPALGSAVLPHAARLSERALIHVARALGRAAEPTAEAASFLEGALANDAERVRRASATALGKLGLRAPADERGRYEAWLTQALTRAGTPVEQKVIVEALGKVGGQAAASLLAAALPYGAVASGDAELRRVTARARVMLDRADRRSEEGRIRGDVTLATPIPLELMCRRGLQKILLLEVPPEWEGKVEGPGFVSATLRGPLASLRRFRVAERVMLRLPDMPVAPGDDLADVVLRGLEAAEPLLEELTEGPIRFRVSWSGGAHRRALTWKLAERALALRSRGSRLVNDPTESLWELMVSERRSLVRFSLSPRGLPDPRFRYRVRDVPAASHPTIAAALARVAGALGDDVVWDPFVGSGLELIERARLGPYRALLGTDLDEAALDAARANLASAGVEASLARTDALSFTPPEAPTLIVTNPPMGRRVHRQGDIGELLERFVARAATVLSPGGRLVWLSPQAERTRVAARRHGLDLEIVALVDMGGFDAELQVLRKR